MVRRYYDLVRMVDAGVGRVLREMEEVSPGAVIVITFDRGEALGERPSLLRDAEWLTADGRQHDHGYPQKTEENLIRTPLIVKLSGQRRGRPSPRRCPRWNCSRRCRSSRAEMIG